MIIDFKTRHEIDDNDFKEAHEETRGWCADMLDSTTIAGLIVFQIHRYEGMYYVVEGESIGAFSDAILRDSLAEMRLLENFWLTEINRQRDEARDDE